MYNILLKTVKNISHKNFFRYVTNLAQYKPFNVGDVIHNYEVLRVQPVSELFITAIELKHTKTNCSHLHLERNDSNNVFNISFHTTPMDDTGVAHILEHIALCGSEKFPVRDPFFKMINRSMATFMNAMTGSDYTMYPFSTQNEKDFTNLLSVYLDAVFFPQIRYFDFLQEGWRLEHTNTNDQSTPIIIKGVVYNEMKGLMTDPSYVFGTQMLQNILPDHTYGCCSGGDPFQIPDLTWQNLKKFHSSHYHPSNARVITYGNFPLRKHLKHIDEQVMSKFETVDPHTDVPCQKRWTEPRSVRVSCSPNDMTDPEKQSTCAVSFLLDDVKNIYDNFVLFILSLLLTDGPNSPMYQALIEPGIGSSYSPDTGYHNHQKESIFSVGLQGIRTSDIGKIQDIILKTMDEVIENGFSKDKIAAVLHTVELKVKHQSSKFGLGLTFNTMPTWQHGADPIESLRINKFLEQFEKDMINSPTFLQDICKKYFKDNNHRLTLSMVPDKHFEKNIKTAEENLIKSKLANVNNTMLTKIYNEGVQLAKDQLVQVNLDCLPTLQVTDIPVLSSPYGVDVSILNSNVQVASFNQPTNGVTYFTAVKTVNHLPQDLLPYLPLFCSSFTQMGSDVNDYKEFDQKESLYTGGLSAGYQASVCREESSVLESCVTFQSHCLEHNIETMFDLWVELMNGANLKDKTRLQTLVRQNAQQIANLIPFNGHSYAMLSASADLLPGRHFDELWGGLTQVKFMQNIAQMSDLSEIVIKLQQIAQYLFARESNNEVTRYSIHSTAEANAVALKSLENFTTKVSLATNSEELGENIMPNYRFYPDIVEKPKDLIQHVIPMPVNFVACSINTYSPYASLDNAALKILGRLLTTKYLLREIREIGGAYGCGARQGADGIFELFSYRDPHSLQTVTKFQDGIKWVSEGTFSDTDIDEAKLNLFQQLDTPISPCNQGMDYFLNGLSKDMKHAHRRSLLAVTRDDIVNVAKKHLLYTEHSNISIIGPENKEISANDKWHVKHSQ